MSSARRAVLAASLSAALAASAPSTATAGSLYDGPGPRPGPSVLYAAAAHAPQLENTGVWTAEPILVSGASAYRAGEFLYQDFLYDDLGAGDAYRYPDDPRYAGNAADLVEVRVRPLAGETAIRLTYDAMLDPAVVAATIGLGDSAVARAMPHEANAREPAQIFVTVHGGTADAVDAATGLTLAPALPVTVDLARRQVEVRAPFALFDPRGGRAVRIAAAAGLWDPLAGRYAQQSAAAFFNVGFRFDEPGNGFRTSDQSAGLAAGDLSAFFASVDFTRLAAGADDDMPGGATGVPQTGFMDRILASAVEDRQGRGDPASHSAGCEAPCALQYSGRLQPYELYVPPAAPPPTGYGLTLDLHGCGNAYNVGFGSTHQRQLGDRGTPSIVLTPEGRGDCYWYLGQSGADVFEAWADVARRYRLDPDLTAVAGISMGGYGAYKLAAGYPDLFARAAAVIPCPSAGIATAPGQTTTPGGAGTALIQMLPALRTVPVISWQTADDQTCPYAQQAQLFGRLDELGYAYSAWTFSGPDHNTMAAQALSESQPLADYLGSARVQRDPARVTYVVDAATDEPAHGLEADHAHWVSGLRLRDRTASPAIGTIDVVSHGFGRGTPVAAATTRQAGILQTGLFAQLPYATQGRDGGEGPAEPVEDRLEITAANIATATIDSARAQIGCSASVDVVSDGPLDVRLTGCSTTWRVAQVCKRHPLFTVPVPVRVPRGERLRSARVSIRGHREKLRGGRARIDLRHRPDAVVRLRVVSLDRHGRTIVRATNYRWCRR